MLFLFSTVLLFSSVFLPTTTNAQLLSNNTLSMQCNQTINGKYYDLTPLHALGDIKITPPNGTYDYYINVCGAVGGPCINHTSAFACQVEKSPNDEFHAVMAYSDWEKHQPPPMWENRPNSTDLLLKFTNGDSCASGNSSERTTIFTFQCDETGTRNITIEENPQCTFNIIYPTKVVCQDAPTTLAPTTAAPTTTVAPTTEAPTYPPTVRPPTQAPTTAAPTTSTPTSAASSSSSTVYDDSSITRAGVGVGIGIGVGCMAVFWLIWCCYDRYRVQHQRPSTTTYGSV